MGSAKYSFYPSQQKCWELIENNLDIELLYPESMRQRLNNPSYIKYIESVLFDGEQYILLDNELYDYAITSLGRVINCKTKRSITSLFPAAKNNDVRIDIRNKKILLSPIFKENRWEFNQQKILEQHIKNIQYGG